MSVLVTGGTGFLGRHLLSLLERRGDHVRVLCRARPLELDGHGVDVVLGSLLDPEAVKKAVKGCTRVYHAAGLVSRDPASAPELYRVHVDGTRLLLEACAAEGVERVLLVSTSGTIAVTKTDEVSDEQAPYRLETVREWPYYLSKIYQERLALAFPGVDLVCVNPSLLLGPGDTRDSSTGDVLKFLRREIPAIPSGGINFVDARDAAAGAILAMERGGAKRRYLLGGPNWTMAEFLERLERVSGVRKPASKVPDGMARLSAEWMDRLMRLRGDGHRGPVDPVDVSMAQHFWYCDSSRARTELGWEPRDPMETLEDTVADLRERHMGAAPAPHKPVHFLETLVTGGVDVTPGEKRQRTKRTRPRART